MISGIELARAYYEDVVAPVVADRFPGLPHAAGRLGSGSDVLGLDDETSRDHDWGLRLTLLVPAAQVAAVDAHLAEALPETFWGLPVRFPTSWDPAARHRVEVAAPRAFTRSRLGVDPLVMTTADWLSVTGQSILEVTGGPVFVDTDGTITRTRRRLAWYPDDVWLAVVAADWRRIAEELPFVGRAGARGDDLGSRVVAGRLAGVVMHLAFLVERHWPPYSKWLGTLFKKLPCATEVGPGLRSALAAEDWHEREQGLAAALEALHRRQREVGLPSVDGAATARFHGRSVLGVTGVGDAVVEALSRHTGHQPGSGAVLGSVEQTTDHVPVLMDAERRHGLVQALWAGPGR